MSSWIKYVPELDGNRDDKNPVTVEILPLTVRGVRRQQKGIVVKKVKGGGIKSNQVDLSDKVFLSHKGHLVQVEDAIYHMALTIEQEMGKSFFRVLP